MAAETITALNLQLVYGQRKENFELSLPVDEAGGVLQVRHLAKRVEDITGVPPANQRLIFRGKSLTNPSTLLIPDGIKNGSKIMLIGTKPSSEDDALIVQLNQAEKTLEKHKKRLSDITSDLDGIHRGFMSKEMQAPALNSLKKQLRGLVENLMKLLETMDGLLLSDSSVEVRAKRKKIVADVNIYLGRCDDLGGGLEDLLLRYSN